MQTVLIAEDDHAAREGLQEMLTTAGFRVAGVQDGEEALQRLSEQSFDLLLVDLWMPRMNGLQLLAHLHSQQTRAKVVVMTADDTPESVLLTLRAKAHRFLPKPIRMDGLLEMLHDLALAPPDVSSLVVLSARPAWVELLVPCVREVAIRLPDFIMRLEADLAPEVRESMGLVFRELLLDLMDRNGHMDANRKLRVSYLRARRMMLYRIASAGYGFRVDDGAGNGNGGSRPVERREHAVQQLQFRVQPGVLLARAQADEVLINEPMNELVVVKYLD